MIETDIVEFAALLDGTCELLTGGKYRPNDSSTAIFFRALSPYPMEVVRAAFAEHVNRSRFSPTPADLLDLLVANDGRLGADEAWALVMAGRDEADTVVWTEEISQAWAIARPVFEHDDVGARVAFRDAYNRLVASARQAGRPCTWRVIEGHDATRRAEAVKAAIALGRLAGDDSGLLAIPGPRDAIPLLEGPTGAPTDTQRAALQAVRDRLAGPKDQPSPDQAAKAQTADLRAAAAARVQHYAASRGITVPKPAPT